MAAFIKNKILFIVLGVAIIIAAVYFIMGGSSEEPVGSLTDVSSNAADALIGRELLNLLAQLKSTKIDASFFDKREFESLRDFSKDIQEQPVGRDNPFAPVGSDGKTVPPASPPTQVPAGGAKK